jgi:hypothetical protein
VVKLRVKEAKSLKDRVIGLIGKDKPFSLILRTHFGIHTFGLKFPIDVLVLDNEGKVMAISNNLKPNRIFLWNPLYEKVVELPSGTIKTKGISVNSKIEVKLI